jgi:hypothetical protein
LQIFLFDLAGEDQRIFFFFPDTEHEAPSRSFRKCWWTGARKANVGYGFFIGSVLGALRHLRYKIANRNVLFINGFRDSGFKQDIRRAHVALAKISLAKNDADQLVPVFRNRSHQVESGMTGEAGFQPLDAFETSGETSL